MATSTRIRCTIAGGASTCSSRGRAFSVVLAIVRVTERFMDVAFAEVVDDSGDLRFTGAFGKDLPAWRGEANDAEKTESKT